MERVELELIGNEISITIEAEDKSVSAMRRIEELGAVVVFSEIGNGSSLAGRDQLEAALRLLEPGDVLLALHPDRLARDTADLLSIAKRVIEKKAVLRIHDPQIVMDGSDMMAEVMLTIFGLVGMMEKHFICVFRKIPDSHFTKSRTGISVNTGQ